MRKSILLGILAVVGLLCVGCGASQQGDTAAGEESTTPILLEEYLREIELLESPLREYGESSSYMQMDDDFVARILYPSGELESLDTEVVKWINHTVNQYGLESKGSAQEGENAELTVDYSSLVLEQRFVSVKLSGVYERPYLAHPIDVSATFNADSVTGKLLTLEEILLPGGREALEKKVMEDTNIKSETVDENFLDHWSLTHEGLEILLVRGEYLPMSDGTVTLLYPYEELDGILSLRFSAEETVTEAEKPEGEVRTEEAAANAIDPGKPMLALTFDDGPSAHTERLLDAIAAHGGKATFFVVGNMLDGRADTLRRMAAEGHEIGGHSWNHRQLTKLSEEELTEQLMNTRAKIYSIAGVDATTVRPPYGSCNDTVKAKAGELGIALINWSVDTLDWKNKDADMVYRAIMDEAKDGAIILCHDLHKTTVDAMERAIPALIEQGYQLVTVSELLTADGEELIPGKVYFKR